MYYVALSLLIINLNVFLSYLKMIYLHCGSIFYVWYDVLIVLRLVAKVRTGFRNFFF